MKERREGMDGATWAVAQLKDTLRGCVAEDIRTSGLRESMINEYYALAGSSRQLLDMLQRTGFVESLAEKDKQEYVAIMQDLSESGIRCQLLVEQSRSADTTYLLAMTPTASKSVN